METAICVTEAVDYEIAVEYSSAALAKSVAEAIKDGWQPHGSPFVVSGSPDSHGIVEHEYGQALIKTQVFIRYPVNV